MDILADELKKIEPFSSYRGSGVYLVCSMNIYTQQEYLHYIGSSKNILRRTQPNNHPYKMVLNSLGNDFFVCLRVIKSNNPKPIEKQMIKKYQPEMNKQWR